MSLLQVRDLSVAFPTEDGRVQAVDNVSFSIDRGRTLAVVGESGSGKSVTSQAIMGLIERGSADISGEILFDGHDLVTASDNDLRSLRGLRMSMIFQDPLSSLHPFYRIGAQLVEAVQIHQKLSKADARSRSIEMLTKVGSPFTASMLRDLISGQKTEHEHILGQMIRKGEQPSMGCQLLKMAYTQIAVSQIKKL